MSKQCGPTHHHACDCREAYFKRIEEWALEAREALKFFGEPYTWSRVWADRNHDSIGTGLLDNMYGSMARAVLAKFPGEKK